MQAKRILIVVISTICMLDKKIVWPEYSRDIQMYMFF